MTFKLLYCCPHEKLCFVSYTNSVKYFMGINFRFSNNDCISRLVCDP